MKVVGDCFAPIPRVVHQIWKSPDVPDHWRAYHASWRRHLPEWEHRLWSDEARRALVVERYPDFLATYDAFPREIQRVDASKYLILHAHGGVYADLDCECLKPIAPLVAPGGAIVGRTRDGVIECAFFGSTPGHALWTHVLDELRSPPLSARLLRGMPGFDCSHVLLSTGTQMLRRTVRRYASRRDAAQGDGLTIYDPKYFSVRSWLDRYEPFPDDAEAFIHHHYTDSWLKPDERRIHQYFTRRHVRNTLAAALTFGLLFAIAWIW